MTTSSNRARILLAEDDVDLREALAHRLRLEGYDVVQLSSGLALLNYLASWILGGRRRTALHPPADAIVTDVRMPGTDGFRIIEGLRAQGWSHPAVIMTAFGDASMRQRAHRLSSTAFFEKPFDPSRLTQVLERMLSRHAHALS